MAALEELYFRYEEPSNILYGQIESYMPSIKKLNKLKKIKFTMSSTLSNEDINALVEEFGEMFWEGRFELVFLDSGNT